MISQQLLGPMHGIGLKSKIKTESLAIRFTPSSEGFTNVYYHPTVRSFSETHFEH
jgi:hypothetical protein